MNKEFKNNVKTFVKLDEEIKKLQKKINKYKKKKNELIPSILDYMEKKDLDDIKINGEFKLKIKQTNQYSTISKSYLQKILIKNLEEPEVANQIIELIYNNRTKKINSNLEIVKK